MAIDALYSEHFSQYWNFIYLALTILSSSEEFINDTNSDDDDTQSSQDSDKSDKSTAEDSDSDDAYKPSSKQKTKSKSKWVICLGWSIGLYHKFRQSQTHIITYAHTRTPWVL